MITFDIIVRFVLTFITIRGESCKRFRSSENITIDPNTCRIETSMTEYWTNRCVEECDKNLQVSCANF